MEGLVSPCRMNKICGMQWSEKGIFRGNLQVASNRYRVGESRGEENDGRRGNMTCAGLYVSNGATKIHHTTPGVDKRLSWTRSGGNGLERETTR